MSERVGFGPLVFQETQSILRNLDCGVSLVAWAVQCRVPRPPPRAR
jgi:hypothetical protein